MGAGRGGGTVPATLGQPISEGVASSDLSSAGLKAQPFLIIVKERMATSQLEMVA